MDAEGGETRWLPARTRALVDEAVHAARTTLGERFVAAVLVGAAATPSRQDRARAPQVLVVARELPLERVVALGAAAQRPMKQGVRIRTLTLSELERSCDAFALEVAEWRDRHVLLAGEDPFTACVVKDADLRLGLEAAFRGLKRRVRNRALADLGTAGRRDHVADALADALERLIVLAHHTLRLMGREVPTEEPALIGAFATAADADPKALIGLRDTIRAGRPLADPMAGVGAMLAFVERGAALLDTLEAP